MAVTGRKIMSIWKESTAPREVPGPARETKQSIRLDVPSRSETVPGPLPIPEAPLKAVIPRAESLIAADITIEGKIEGGGSVRIAGKFKGEVNVQGDLTIEVGAKLTGGVRADKVTIAGELEGNVEAASHVDLLQTGAVTGDMKAGALTVASGARMRGQSEFGWTDVKGANAARHGNGHGDSGVGS